MGRGLASQVFLPLCGLALLWPLRAQAQECLQDSDCGEGFECDQPPSGASSRDCPPGAECEPVADPAPQVGECEAMELTCMADADCPSGATCELSNDDCDSVSQPAAPPDSGDDQQSSGAAGGAAPPQEAPERNDDGCEPATEGQCVFTLVECTSNSQCTGADLCTALGTRRRCSGGGVGSAATPPACAGDGCPEPEPRPAPAPEEETCTETTVSYCFPRPVDCSDGDACGAGERCVELPEDVQEDAPAGWEGASALCLPEVWALAIEGRIEIEGGGSSGSDGASSGQATRGDSKSKGESADGDEAQSADDCAVSAPGARGARASWPLLGGALFAFAAVRRRGRKASGRG
jgi:hypothetical protein